jgi:general secretion pathway protein L
LLLAGELLRELDGLGREIVGLDDQIATRQAMLRRLQSGTMAREDASPLASLPPRVRTLEDLSKTLPDDAYLTSLTMRRDRLQVTGLAAHAANLVPTLEESKHFAEVAFTGAIMRADEGRGDRFQLEMRIADGDSPP